MTFNFRRSIYATAVGAVYICVLMSRSFAARPALLPNSNARDIVKSPSKDLSKYPALSIRYEKQNGISLDSKSSSAGKNIFWYGLLGIGACVIICIPAHIVAEDRRSSVYYIEGAIWLSILASGITYQTISAKLDNRAVSSTFYIASFMVFGTLSAISFIQGAMNDNYLIQSNDNYRDLFFSNIGINSLLAISAIAGIILTAWTLDLFEPSSDASENQQQAKRVRLIMTTRTDSFILGAQSTF